MCADNMTLGRFELTGLPAAPRGVPQIEVTFDIDANGIVNVSAKDLGTGKEQSIRITASSGLSEEEIQNLVKDAEAHADEDKQRQKLIEARNHADSLIYTTEKSLRDLGDKVDAALKGEIETKIEELKKIMEGDNAEAITKSTEELAQSSHKLAEKLYAQKSGEAQSGAGQPGADQAAGSAKSDDEDVVDADYTEVK
jgi:molecular chaperone DnaK